MDSLRLVDIVWSNARVFLYDRPDQLTKHSATETIFTIETSEWKPSLIVRTAWQNILWHRRSLPSEMTIWQPGLTCISHPENIFAENVYRFIFSFALVTRYIYFLTFSCVCLMNCYSSASKTNYYHLQANGIFYLSWNFTFPISFTFKFKFTFTMFFFCFSCSLSLSFLFFCRSFCKPLQPPVP